MKLGFCTSVFAWAGWELEPIFVLLSSAGYEGIELQYPREKLPPPDDLRGLASRYDLGIAAWAHGVRADFVSPQAQAQLHTDIEFAAAIGAPVLMAAGPMNEAVNTDMFAEGLDEAAALAAESKITFAYHNHMDTPIETAEQMLGLARRTRNLAFCPDTAHLALAGGDCAEVVRQLCRQPGWQVALCPTFPAARPARERPTWQRAYPPGRIGHFHVKDYAIRPAAFPWREWKAEEFCEPGQGRIGIDFRGTLAALREAGYLGWVIVELDRPAERPLEDSVRLSREFMAELMQ